jgi:hypothetical protein
MATGRYPQAITELLAEEGGRVPTEIVLASLGQVYGLQGKNQEAEKVLAELMQRSKKTYVSPSFLAYVYVGLSDRCWNASKSAGTLLRIDWDKWVVPVRGAEESDRTASSTPAPTEVRARAVLSDGSGAEHQAIGAVPQPANRTGGARHLENRRRTRPPTPRNSSKREVFQLPQAISLKTPACPIADAYI